MRRLSALAVLLTLALPFARAPLCETGAHEHEQARHRHGPVAVHPGPAADGAAADADCHDLMGCRLGASLVASHVASPGPAHPRPANEIAMPRDAAPEGRAAPELPPPRTV